MEEVQVDSHPARVFWVFDSDQGLGLDQPRPISKIFVPILTHLFVV